MASDARFALAGFKYPERIFGHKFQAKFADKPALLSYLTGASAHERTPKYTKFGPNLGPKRPVKPISKFLRTRHDQSPLLQYRRDEKRPVTLDAAKVDLSSI